jgi:hypothetical protein
VAPRARGTTAKRAAFWCFREIETLRRTFIQRAGRIIRLIRPVGKLILSMNSNEKLENELLKIGVRTQFSLIYLLQYATISHMEVTNVAQTKIYLTWNSATCYTTG